VPDIDETILPNEEGEALVLRLAKMKADKVAALEFKTEERPKIILACDTIVLLENEILNKPNGADDAVKMLHKLSGKSHEVISGVALLTPKESISFTCQTTVKVASLTSSLIASYVATNEPLDKAGGYGIQGKGACLIESINGSYTNVVGLPVYEVYQHLLKALNED
jgi:septum formation protein